MKIEKVNDYQIRCTLTKEDLARRGIRVSELSYGTKLARDLFKDMMQQAGDEFGFSTEDFAIMVEAIPVNSDCIILVITKCDDPEELDTRFASFAPSVFYNEDDDDDDDEDADDDEDDDDPEDMEGSYEPQSSEEYADMFSRIQEGGMSGLFESDYPAAKKVKKKPDSKPQKYVDKAPYRIYSFPLLMDVLRIAARIDSSYKGRNTLYQNNANGTYMLLLHSTGEEDSDFAGVCLILTEYGKEIVGITAGEQYLEEHYSVLIRDFALQTLREQA